MTVRSLPPTGRSNGRHRGNGQAPARAGRLSTFHFHRLFKKRFGETAFEVVVRLQVERSKELMLQGVPLADVGRRVGFNSQSHFSTRFKQATGVTPARWLRQN